VQPYQQRTERDLIDAAPVVRNVIRYEHVALAENQLPRRGDGETEPSGAVASNTWNSTPPPAGRNCVNRRRAGSVRTEAGASTILTVRTC
jgi:hypothetical protein